MNLLLELGILFLICLVGEWIAALLPFVLPSSVISMLLLLALLLCGAVKERSIQSTARFLIGNMGLFFVPALVGTLEYLEILQSQAIPFLVVSLLTTPIIYFFTAWSIQLAMKLLVRRKERRHG